MATNLLQAAQEDERRKAAALGQPRPNSFGDAAAVARSPGVTQTPTGMPAPAAKDPLDGGAAFGVFPQLAGGKRTTYAMDDKLRTGVQATGPSTFAQATPTEKTIVGGGDGRRWNAEQDPRSLLAASTSLANAGRGVVNPPAVNPPTVNPPAPAPSPSNAPAPDSNPTATAPGNVTRVGNSYSGTNVAGDITVNGQAPRGGFMVADGPRGFSPGAPAATAPQGVTAPTVLNSSNSWQARNDLRNLEVSASSITNNGGRFDQTKGKNPAQAAYMAALQADAAARGAQPGLDAVAMRENAGIQREGMQQAGATTRTGMTEQGANARESGRNILARDEFNLRKEASGFQTRAAQQQEQLRNVLLDPKATPEQRAVAQRNLAALSGKTAADRMQTVALPDTTNEMGQVVRGGQALVRVLEDGSVQQVPIGAQQGAAMPPGMTKQVGTSNGRPVYEDAKGNRFVG